MLNSQHPIDGVHDVTHHETFHFRNVRDGRLRKIRWVVNASRSVTISSSALPVLVPVPVLEEESTMVVVEDVRSRRDKASVPV
jgi:hypothetical protein